MSAHAIDIDRARAALWALDAGVNRREWVRIGCAAKAAGLGFEDFHDWSSTAGNYGGQGDTSDAWKSFKQDGGVNAGTLFHLAREAGWADPANNNKPQRDAKRAAPLREWWDRGQPAAANHGYITRKHGTPDGLRMVSWPLQGWAAFKGRNLEGWLMVPVRSPGGDLASIQFIGPNGGEKLNAFGCPMAGAFTAGTLKHGAPAYIVEGIGHAWSINAVTGRAAVVSFGVANIEKAAAAIKAAGAVPVIVADRGKEGDARAAALRQGCEFVTLPADMANGADVNDLHLERGADAVRDVLARATHSVQAMPVPADYNTQRPTCGWEAIELMAQHGITLAANTRQEPYPNLDNTIAVLQGHPRFVGRIWHDAFHQDIFTTWDCDEPRPWVDADRLRVATVFQREFGLAKFGDDLIDKAAIAVAQADQRDELRDWLQSLRWDGTPRLNDWLQRAVGAPDDEYHHAIGRNFILSMVARGLVPGCKVDTMPVFEGAQGAGKSKLLGILGGKYYAELTESLDTKDFFVVIQGVWVCEIAELDAFRRTDVTRIKQVLSSQQDRCRLPYAKRAVNLPRRVVFAGSTNEHEYLRDATGARRFWPLTVASIDHDWLQRNRVQLFAEAVEAFQAKATWWDVPADAAKAQTDERRETDAWEPVIAEWCIGHREVLISDVLAGIGVDVSRQDKTAQMRATNILKTIGYHKGRIYRAGKQLRGWVRDDAASAGDDRPL
ncbi:PriCT-2 domain-containing protein [Ralstonia solanacearum]|uniref:VapE domain-containing protein n=1 Tax=Ralstonia solanacearum TaxID=305 RepID=UPI000696DFC8|nr:VapE domain-containing protein [Ralstonia solanacearum]MDB0539762.1 PriCT-2 domain-containing protein [Ralstonia solanacearum]MDB0549744.1 PriCT-2 domain-containing protein [Ralstonia solanacearum]MDB0555348.1 PriCT-2 domain-containing protein [Ralstonia solanacearum]